MKEFGPRLIRTGAVMCCSTCGHMFVPDQEDDMTKAFTDHIRKAHRAKDDPSRALNKDSKGLHKSCGLDWRTNRIRIVTANPYL